MSPSGFRGVVLDLDGTLIDTIHDSRAALNRIFGDDGLRSLSYDEVRGIVGAGARTMLQRALALHGLPTDDDFLTSTYVDRYMAAYLADPISHTIVYPGVRETLELLRNSGVALGICTNKPRTSTQIVLDLLFPEHPFSAIICPEDVLHRKPDGRHVLAVMKMMGVPSPYCVMVGDSEIDIVAAAGAGIPAIAVTYGYCHVPIETLSAAAIIKRFDHLPAALNRLALQLQMY